MLKIGIYDTKTFILDTGPFLYLLLNEYDENSDEDVYSKTDKVSSLEFTRKKADYYKTFLQTKEVYITPHVLAEASNLLESNDYKVNCGEVFNTLTSFLKVQVEEEHIEKKLIFGQNNDLSVGVADFGLLKIADKKDFTIIYQDGDMEFSNSDFSFKAHPLGEILITLSSRK